MRTSIVALLLVATVACGQTATGPSTGNEVGTYSLVSVNGNAVPCNLTQAGTSVQITSGSLTLSSGGSIRIVTAFTVNGQATATDVGGTYTRSGNNFVMHYSTGGVNTGTLNGTEFTMNNEGVAFAYHRS